MTLSTLFPNGFVSFHEWHKWANSTGFVYRDMDNEVSDFLDRLVTPDMFGERPEYENYVGGIDPEDAHRFGIAGDEYSKDRSHHNKTVIFEGWDLNNDGVFSSENFSINFNKDCITIYVKSMKRVETLKRPNLNRLAIANQQHNLGLTLNPDYQITP